MGVFKRNGNWWIDYYVNGRRKREKIGPSKKLAEIVLNKRKVEIAEGKYLDVKKVPQITFEELGMKYLEWSKVNKRSWWQDMYSIKRLNEYFGGKRISEIHPLLIEGYKQKRVLEVSKRKVDIELACLKHMFTKGMEWGLTAENPAFLVKLFRHNNARLRYLSEEEIARLIEACSENLRPLVIVALHTGMRKSEILNLRWKDIDFINGVIHVEDTKNGERRDIPMTKTVQKEISKLRECSESEWVFVHKKDPKKPLRDIRTPFYSAVRKAGIKNFRFHDLRHTAASWMVMKGIDLYRVQHILGHKDSRMTQRYAHLSPFYLKDAAEMMNTIGHYLDTGGGSGKVANFSKLL